MIFSDFILGSIFALDFVAAVLVCLFLYGIVRLLGERFFQFPAAPVHVWESALATFAAVSILAWFYNQLFRLFIQTIGNAGAAGDRPSHYWPIKLRSIQFLLYYLFVGAALSIPVDITLQWFSSRSA